jgi:predicted MFS family arabinose efflux permease
MSCPPSKLDAASDRPLSRALVTIALLGAVIGSLGAPLITSVATGFGVSLDAAQWTLTATLFAGAMSAPVVGRWGAGPRRRTTILGTLAVVALGGVLGAAPLPFSALLIGRALQGVGLGVIPLLMSVARDRLAPDRGARAIATISVASTVGIGVGYPLIGLLDQVAGLRTAYGLGLALSVLALGIAWRALPVEPPRPAVRVDVPGAILLGIGILGILVAVAQPWVWERSFVGATILVVAVAAIAAFGVVERRAGSPLVDLRLLAQPPALRANIAMLLAGAGMYLLFSLLVRYLQTPATAGYGFALPGVLSGSALIPFSVLGFVAGKLVPPGLARFSGRWIYAAAALSVVVAVMIFAAVPGSLAMVLAAMAVLGLGVGGVSAVMPRLVLTGVPSPETASVLSVNQIVRSIGFSIGSALAGLLLAAATPAGSLAPTPHGYVSAALWTVPLVAASMVAVCLRWPPTRDSPG